MISTWKLDVARRTLACAAEVDDAVAGNVRNVGAYELEQHVDVDSGPVEVGRVVVDTSDRPLGTVDDAATY